MHETPYYRYRLNAGRATTIYAAASAKDQNTPLDKPGLTIVTFVRATDRYQLRCAIARLQQAHPSFRSFASALHLTITGVLPRDQPEDLSAVQRHQIELAVADVMREVFSETPQFALVLQSIEPGGDAKRPSGNVVAVAAPASRHYIEHLGARLREKLNPRLAKIYPGLEAAPAKGVKITLGFFDREEDFRLDRELAAVFEELRHLETEFWVERVALVRFGSKSLTDAETLDEIQLPSPADTPIRQVSLKPKMLVAPHWVRWCGFSYLWDNPGASYRHYPKTQLKQIACEPWTDPALSLYRALGDALAKVGLDSTCNAFTFCPLPSPSYHVTAWDGINDENLSQIAAPAHQRFAEFLLGLPGSANDTPPDLIPPDAFEDVMSTEPVQFRFGGLSVWGDLVLVARLLPVGEKSAELLQQISKRRDQLDKTFAPIGRPPSLNYTPHISLGYFGHPRGARLAATDLLQWEGIFRRRVAGCRLTLHSISAYAFESMETFLKLEFAGHADAGSV